MKSFYNKMFLHARLLKLLNKGRVSTFNAFQKNTLNTLTNRPIVMMAFFIIVFSSNSAFSQTQVTGVVKDR